jgi:hypothetical protein
MVGLALPLDAGAYVLLLGELELPPEAAHGERDDSHQRGHVGLS